jgi:hypothetical protein
LFQYLVGNGVFVSLLNLAKIQIRGKKFHKKSTEKNGAKEKCSLKALRRRACLPLTSPTTCVVIAGETSFLLVLSLCPEYK